MFTLEHPNLVTHKDTQLNPSSHMFLSLNLDIHRSHKQATLLSQDIPLSHSIPRLLLYTSLNQCQSNQFKQLSLSQCLAAKSSFLILIDSFLL